MKKFGLAILIVICTGLAACGGHRVQTEPDRITTFQQVHPVTPVLVHEWIENKGRHEVHIVIRNILPKEDGSDDVIWEGVIPVGRPAWVPKIREGMIVEGYFSARTTDITHTKGVIERILIRLDPTENGWAISCGSHC